MALCFHHFVGDVDGTVHESEEDVRWPSTVLSFRTEISDYFVQSVHSGFGGVVKQHNFRFSVILVSLIAMHGRNQKHRLFSFVKERTQSVILGVEVM